MSWWKCRLLIHWFFTFSHDSSGYDIYDWYTFFKHNRYISLCEVSSTQKLQHGLPWMGNLHLSSTVSNCFLRCVRWTWAQLTVNWKIRIIESCEGNPKGKSWRNRQRTLRNLWQSLKSRSNLAADTVPSTSAQLACLTWLEIFCDRHCYMGVTAVYIVTPQIICYIVVLKVL